ncbi:MAG: hypothetical protein EBX52_11585, partial [Proteobacteria bacterium]|nr:hypothetical protein [Pseudomonadota bacterium]
MTELMQETPVNVNSLAGVKDETAFKDQVMGAIDTRNQLFNAWKANPNDAKLYKQYTTHDKAVKEMEYLARKRMGLSAEEGNKLFAKPEVLVDAGKAATTATADVKVATQSGTTKGVSSGGSSGASTSAATSLNADQSLDVIVDYSKKYNGQKLADERELLNKMPVSTEKGRRIDQMLEDQENALKTLGDIKKTHSTEFQKMTKNRVAQDADVMMSTRERTLKESIEKLRKDKADHLADVKNANLTVENSATGDLSESALKNAASDGKKPGAGLMSKVKDQIADLERVQKNFKKGELAALDKIDLEHEIKRLKAFVTKVESPGPVKTVVFSKDGQRVENFQDVLTHVKSGDRLSFSDGAGFDIKSRLGGEASTEIFETTEGKVIRVNKRPKETGAWTVDSYRKGYEDLKNSDIPIVHVMDPANASKDYVVVEKFNKKYDLSELYKKAMARQIPEAEYKDRMMEFEKFIVKTKDYTALEDFHPGQVVYDEKRGWILADYGAENTKFNGVGNATAV